MADKTIISTPKGTAIYPRLNKPDTKFDENGQYKADLAVDNDLAEPFKKHLSKLYKDWVGKPHPKNPEKDSKTGLWYAEVDEDGEETGRTIFKLRVKNKINKKTGELWDRRPVQFDAKGRPINKPKAVGGGTEMIVSAEVYFFTAATGAKGMSLQPLAVQILQLVEFSGTQQNAASYGFSSQDGYVADDDEQYDEPEDDNDDDVDDDSVPADEDDDY